MYAGISSLNSEKNQNNDDIITGMNSREGESVNYEIKINIGEDSRINVWLGKNDDQMRISLASRLELSVKEISLIE